MIEDPTPFTVAVEDRALRDLRDRLLRARLPTGDAVEDPRFGLTASALREFLEYWLDEYDWRAEEAAINALPNSTAVLDGRPVYFVHQRGIGPRPMPLVLTHGYPWSFWDYRKVIGPLTDPAAYGGDPADAFHVVVPSLPGYCFSAPLRPRGFSVRQVAALWVRLMRDTLGYERFGAAGGDWGSIVLGHEHPDALHGVYVTLPNFSPALRNRFDPFTRADLGPEERDWYESTYRHKLRDGQTYQPPTGPNFHAPHTEAYAGVDSPLATRGALQRTSPPTPPAPGRSPA